MTKVFASVEPIILSLPVLYRVYSLILKTKYWILGIGWNSQHSPPVQALFTTSDDLLQGTSVTMQGERRSRHLCCCCASAVGVGSEKGRATIAEG